MNQLRRELSGASPYPLLILAGLNFMDWADQSAYGVLLPDIRDALHLTDTGILLVSAIGGALGLLLTVPIAWMADRSNRIRIALIGATVWALFSISTGFATVVALLVIVRCGAAVGQAVVFPTHNSLLADYYPIDSRPKVYASHQLGNVLGQLFGVLAGAGLASAFNWRVPFVVFGIPRDPAGDPRVEAHEPIRGSFERAAAGIGDQAEAEAEAEPPPSYAEAYRMVWKIGTLRRIFAALPFLAASIIGFAAIAALQYDRTFHLDTIARGWVSVPVLITQVGGLALVAKLATRMAAKGMSHVFRLIGWAATVAALLALVFAAAPTTWVAVAAHAGIVASLAIVGPGVLASLSLAIPLPGPGDRLLDRRAVHPPGLGRAADRRLGRRHLGHALGHGVMTPVFIIGGLIIASAGKVVDADIAEVWTGAPQPAPRCSYDRRAGRDEAAARPRPRRALRRRAGAVRRRHRGRRGRDRRPARHQRRRQVDAAQGDLRASSRPTSGADRLRRPRHHPRAARTRSRRSAWRRCPAARACSRR